MPQYWEGERLVNRFDSLTDGTGDIDCDQSGTPWTVWWGEQNSMQKCFFTRWNGTDWAEEELLYADTFLNFCPLITFDKKGTAWVVWTQEAVESLQWSGHGDFELFFTRWNGTSWEQARQLNPTNPRLDAAFGLASGGDQIWCVSWSYPLDRSYWQVFASCWNGVNWDTLRMISPADSSCRHGFPSITVDERGRPHIVWCDALSRVIYYRTRNDNSWSVPRRINDPNIVPSASWGAPQIAVDNEGNLHVVWVGVAAGETDWDIFYSKFDGEQWLAPIRINCNDDYHDFYPTITVSSPEDIWVIWDKEFSFWDNHIYASHFNGVAWSTEERLDNRCEYNCYNRVTSDLTGNPWVIWNGITLGIDHGCDVYSNRYSSVSVIEPYAKLSFSPLSISPNPFSYSTEIRFELLSQSDIAIEVYDVSGKLVKTFEKYRQKPGRYTLIWDGTNDKGIKINRGVYICKFTNGRHSVNKKIVFLR